MSRYFLGRIASIDSNGLGVVEVIDPGECVNEISGLKLRVGDIVAVENTNLRSIFAQTDIVGVYESEEPGAFSDVLSAAK